jgi:hypothetical protein
VRKEAKQKEALFFFRTMLSDRERAVPLQRRGRTSTFDMLTELIGWVEKGTRARSQYRRAEGSTGSFLHFGNDRTRAFTLSNQTLAVFAPLREVIFGGRPSGARLSD